MRTIIYRMGNNEVLLYNTGNYIQYPVINHNGKRLYICNIRQTESLCYTAEIKHNFVNQLYFNKIKFKKKASTHLGNCDQANVSPTSDAWRRSV